MFLFAKIVFVNVIVVILADERTAIVNTTIGPMQGVIQTTVHSTPMASFRGIRYAQPPLGYLRFKPPVPIEPWTEVLDATVELPACPQIDLTTNRYRGDEDCLYLNVHTPVTNLSTTPTDLKAVMVWIYGGSFLFGSASTEHERPDFLIDRDVVFVSINYRLGPLGFLSLNHPNATGNQGLKDQLLGLKWIRANIEKFGGNPNNVTVFGESAGAVATGLHVISDASVGLFHGAISMSGTPLVPWGYVILDDAIWRGQRLGIALGTFTTDNNALLSTFYAASAEQLVTAAAKVSLTTPFPPTLEDPSVATEIFLSECAIKKYLAGNFTKMPQIIGFMEQETIAFLGYFDVFFELLNESAGILDRIENAVAGVLHTLEEIFKSIDKWFNQIEDTVLESGVNITTDVLFKSQIDQTIRLLVSENNNKPIYYYDITFFTNRSRHNLDSNFTLDGAGHADDIAYIFYIPADNYDLDINSPMGLAIYRVSTMWTNFAKYGNPTPSWVDQYPLNVTWPPTGTTGKALDIGTELTVVPRPISSFTQLVQISLRPIASVIDGCY